MNAILSTIGRSALKEWQRTGKILYAFDFDGTLAPIVLTNAASAQMTTGVANAFLQLASRWPTAIVTGRGKHDILARLGDYILPTYLLADHGADGMPGISKDQREAFTQICMHWEQQLSPMLAANPKLMLERKHFTLFLHTKENQIKPQLAQHLADLHPAPQLIADKYGYNLLPPQAPNKATALCALQDAESFDKVLYIGDDQSDEAVFAAAPADWLTIHVGQRQSQAAYCLSEQSQIETLLRWLVSAPNQATEVAAEARLFF